MVTVVDWACDFHMLKATIFFVSVSGTQGSGTHWDPLHVLLSSHEFGSGSSQICEELEPSSSWLWYEHILAGDSIQVLISPPHAHLLRECQMSNRKNLQQCLFFSLGAKLPFTELWEMFPMQDANKLTLSTRRVSDARKFFLSRFSWRQMEPSAFCLPPLNGSKSSRTPMEGPWWDLSIGQAPQLWRLRGLPPFDSGTPHGYLVQHFEAANFAWGSYDHVFFLFSLFGFKCQGWVWLYFWMEKISDAGHGDEEVRPGIIAQFLQMISL